MAKDVAQRAGGHALGLAASALRPLGPDDVGALLRVTRQQAAEERVRLARARLAVGEDGRVKTAERRVDGRADMRVGGALHGGGPEDGVELSEQLTLAWPTRPYAQSVG